MERSVTSQAQVEQAGLVPWIFGLHDPGDWQDIFHDAGKTGWVMFNQVVDEEFAARGNPEFAEWAGRGFGVLARLVNAPFDVQGRGRGSIPLPEEYEQFARRCAEFVRNSPGCHIWFIGNEMNIEWHWPLARDGRRAQPITPDQYAVCFRQVHAAIKEVQPEAWVIPSAVNPLRKPNAQHDDGLRWFQSMVQQVRGLDGYDIHAYFPLADGKDEDKAYPFGQFLERIPLDQQHLPVFITESTPPLPWPKESDGWMQRTYATVNRWNRNPGHQAVYALLPYRWGQESSADYWSLADEPSYRDDLRQAVQYDYRWSIDPDQRFGDPVERAEALRRISVVEPEGDLPLFNVPAEAYVYVTDTKLKFGLWESGRILAYASAHPSSGEKGGLLDRFRSSSRSSESASELLRNIEKLAPLPLGQAAAVEAGVFGARHLIVTPVREADKGTTGIEDSIATGLQAALTLADRLGDVQRIALPAIATDELDAARAARIVLSTLVAYLEKGSRLQEVAVVPDNAEQYRTYQDALSSLGSEEPPGERQVWLVTALPANWARAFQAGQVAWTEVKGAKAQQNLQQARTGDIVLAYRSTPDRFIAGLGHIIREPYPYQDRHAVDIAIDLTWDQGVTLDELRQAVPELEQVTTARLSFSRVEPAEWAVIRELIRYHNPGLAPDALPASTEPPQHRAEIVEVTLSDDIQASETLPVSLSLRNRGNVTWAAGERLHIACHWWPATEGRAEQPATTWNWTPELDRAVPPGDTIEFADLEEQPAPGPGRYEVHLTASGLSWEEGATMQSIAAAQATVTRTVAAPPTVPAPAEFESGTDADLASQVRAAIAASELDHALSLANSITEAGSRGRALEDVVRAMAQAGQVEQALQTARQIKAEESRGYALSLVASYLPKSQSKGVLSEAQSAFEAALAAAQAQDDLKAQVQTLLQIGQIQERSSDRDGAMDTFQKALSIAQRSDDRQSEIYVQRQIGGSYLRLGQPERALAAFQEALAIAQKLDDQNQVMSALNDLGTAYHHLGQDDRALDSYRQAMGIARESGDESAQNMVLFGLTSLVRDLAGQEGAPDYYRQALDIVREQGNAAQQIEMLDAVGSVCRNQHDYRQALDLSQQALKLAQEAGDQVWQGRMLERLASICHDQGEYKQALEYCRQMLAPAQEAADPEPEAQAHECIGAAHYGAGDYVNAVQAYQQALALWQKRGDRSREAACYEQLGAVHGDMADVEAAQEAYQQALAIRREAGDRDGELWILADLGELYRRHFDQSRAVDFYQQALAIAQQQDDRQQAATIHERLADVYRYLGDQEQAQAHDRQTLDISQAQLSEARSAGDRVQEAEALSDIGRASGRMSDYEAAQQAYHQALSIWQETGDGQGEARTLVDLGNLARDQHDPQQAVSYYEQALTIARKTGDRGWEASLLSNLGSAHRQMGSLDEAQRAFEQVVTLCQETGDRGGEIWAGADLGSLARDRKEPQQAQSLYEQALAIAQETGDRRQEASMLSNVASVQRDLANYEQALALYQQVLSVQREMGDRRGEAWTLADIGDLWHAQADQKQAMSTYQQALDMARQIHDRDLEATAQARFGAVYRAVGDYQQALAAYQQALALRQGQRERIWRMWLLDDLGSVYVDLSDFEQALAHYQQALTIAREIGERQWEAVELYHLGSVYRTLGRTAEALDHFQQSLAIYQQLGLQEDIQRLQDEIRTLSAPPTEKEETAEVTPPYRAGISLLEPPPDALWPGETTEPSVPKLEVRNLGARDWATEGEGEVVLDYSISADIPGFDPIGEMLLLPKAVPAGGSAVVEAPFTVPTTAGEYRIRWGLSYRPGGPDSGYEALPLDGRPAASFRVMSLDEGQKWLDEALAAPSPAERQRYLARIGSVLQTGPEPDIRRLLVEEGLFRGLFDPDWTVGRTALYALHQARRWYDGLDSWLEAQFAGDQIDLAPAHELSSKRLRRDEKEWLQQLLAPKIAPTPLEYDGALRLQTRPPTEAWPGEKIPVEFLVDNKGTGAWPVTGATAVQLLYRLGSQVQVHRLPAVAAGETVPYAATYTLPDEPGGYELTWQLVQGGDATGQTGSPLGKPLREKVAVLDLAETDLPALVGKDATGLAPEVRGRRLAEIGRRLQADTALDPAQRQEIVKNELAPGLFSSSTAVRAAALETLHDLSEQDAEIDQVLHDSLDKPEKELDPLASSAAAISAQVKDWLDGYLPDALRSAARPAIVVPAQPQVKKTEAVSLSIRPDEIVLEYDGKSFQSKNKLDDAPLSQARADRKPPRVYGELLFDGLFNHEQTGGSGSTYDGFVKIKDEGDWHLELQIDPAVPAYRWEYLCNKYDPSAQPLAVYQQRPLFRRIENNRPVDASPADPLSILVAICNPITLRETPTRDADDLIAGLAKLDVAQERAIVESGLQRLQEAGLAEYKILESQTTGMPVTLDALVRELKEGHHVLHILAHGLFHNNVFWLVMEDDNRKHKVVRAEEFESALTDYGLRLVVLASCQSALPGQAGGTFPGLGALLVKQGIPAVVAMQDNVSVESAQIFTQRFYDDLARTGRIDTALAATRYDLYRYNRRRWDWGIPVLFMNSWDGRFFAVKDERLQQAPPPLKFGDLDIKSYDELPGEGDPMPRALADAVQAQVRAVRDDPAMLTAMRSLIAAQTGQVSARKAPPLAREQERATLDKLAHEVQIDARNLAHFVKSETDMEIPLEVYQQVASALNAGKHVVLTGAPGTGKTSLSHAICQYACQHRFCAGMAFTTATADWTTFDTIGGYVPTEQQTLEFRPGIFLEAVANGHWLVIDEINRAEIDKAFGELFTVLSGQQVDLPYKVENVPVRILPAAPRPRGQEPGPLYWARKATTGYDYVITPSWRIIGTMNVYDKSYLFNMSFAFMRRFAFVDIDLPEPTLYHSLVRRWFDKNGLPVQDDPLHDSDGLKELTETLHALIAPKTPLMTRRALGPAIIKDMAEYIGDRYVQDGKQDPMLLCYLGEAFQLYALPQLDGLDHEGILEVYAHLHHLFRSLERYHGERPGMLPLLLARIGLLYPHIQADEWDGALEEWKRKHPEAETMGGPVVDGGPGGR